MVVSRSAASRMRFRVQCRGNGLYQARASGTTISAPDASPSHHVRQTVGAASPCDHSSG